MVIEKITEGKARILAYTGRIQEISKKAAVFYNPKMKHNRDISVLALTVFQEELSARAQSQGAKKESIKSQKGENGIVVADCLSATGVRGIRYALEVPQIFEVIFSDLNPAAIKLIKKNVAENKIKNATIEEEDAVITLARRKSKIDFIDIDPFGTPIQFLDSSARAISLHGMLAITATDTAPLSGTYPRAAYRKYGAKSMRCDMQHELGIRILIANIVRDCAKYDKGFTPVLSFSELHYFRVFGRVKRSKSAADISMRSIGYFIFCKKCGRREFMPDNCRKECADCGEKTNYAGPLWNGRIFDSDFCAKVFEKSKPMNDAQLLKLLGVIREESLIDAPWYELGTLASIFRVNPPRIDAFIEKLRKAGFRASRTHFSPTGVRTDANLLEIRSRLR
ncbi:tRNA (guanine(10)-N(2))-dimethyltransferase [archaeon]|nr:tRNA (guanine(10)-N(2))-dimethyltransferase [Nanoarchaeota archaeon]MBU4301094.1 tRNA (guanine(10)-N(2))-dimethyltransferase [Nanoarchaeota archaeon]MBU4451910.1 tRNA (guanine(10)-N(2))-dimethyltransferase [Nanoarchaeota archaeon]MCG2724605.1 tRNA (guanine(10)-N(2))-dimethyltransferase [archaeon]